MTGPLGCSELRSFVRRSPEAMAFVRDGVVVEANAVFARVIGAAAPEAITGRALVDLVLPGDRAAAAALLGAAPSPEGGPLALRFAGAPDEGGDPLVVEVRRDGPVLLDDAPVDVLIARDVTAERRVRARLLLADRMLSVGTLAAGAAHEINNPLAVASSNLQFALDELERMRGRFVTDLGAIGRLDGVLEALREAQASTQRIRRVVVDLKTFSGGNDERREPVDVRRALDSALSAARNELRHRAEVSREYGEVPLVTANEARLAQVFLNLLLNAAQALPEGQTDKHRVTARSRLDEAGDLLVEIEDSGEGIPPAIRSRVFDPFFTTRRVGAGLGLGLTVCHNLVDAMGGEISLLAAGSRGTIARVRLPSRLLLSPTAAEPDLVDAAPRRARVLIVDDEPMVANALRRTLLGEHDIETCLAATEAIDRITAGERYDVILCDLMMPELTGMDLHAALDGEAPDQARRMLFVTGGAFTPRAREFLAQAGRARVDKPYDPGKLRDTIRGLVARFGPPVP